ncbi:acetyl-CoA C-acyltransferase [Agrococcus terreus]|uniref:Probable acetyl-CoA acetyltransferase n=1 Tax=Agrococcus terreus TaxID=574649 RepID=A0ABQ2KJX3_9MICO|nr:acetyl-CoA C-acyltransferase [Agrococcus terreus]GGN85665.1 acetyl-CoA acetyltransferase [Agrococcus terreus]
MPQTLIAGYARTPFARFLGQLAQVPSTALGAHAAKHALEKAGVAADAVDAVVVGQVLPATVGQNPPRQTAVGAGIPMTVPALGVNAVCLSGTEAIVTGHRMIQLGEADVVVAVGQESMTLAPHAAPLRAGSKFGATSLIDTMQFDGLTDAFDEVPMGESTDGFNERFEVTREQQDAFAAESHRRLAAAQESGALDDEIVPIETGGRRSVTVSTDDGVRADTTAESLAGLRPAFVSDGTITAGNASQITDGAAAVVLVSDAWAAEHGVTGIARILSTGFVAGADVSLHSQPADAIEQALGRAGRTAADLQAVEINEAFAAVGLVSTRQLGVDAEIVNANGGAIALGHPIGASGTRIVGHLARRLAQAGSGAIGAAGICGGGGQGSAIVLEAV